MDGLTEARRLVAEADEAETMARDLLIRAKDLRQKASDAIPNGTRLRHVRMRECSLVPGVRAVSWLSLAD
jgi:hypothetical protein